MSSALLRIQACTFSYMLVSWGHMSIFLGGSCHVPPCSNTGCGRIERTGPMAEAATQCRTDATRAIDLPQCPGYAGPGAVGDAASARGIHPLPGPTIQRGRAGVASHASPPGAHPSADARRRVRGGGDRQDAPSSFRRTLQSVVAAQADRLSGGAPDDPQGLARDHRQGLGPA